MFQRGIRGAITLDSNSVDEIKSNTVELLNALVSSNHIETRDISHVIFTLTSDLTAAFPAKFARTELYWDDVPMVCFNELKVDGSIEMCMRVLIVVNTEKSQRDIRHIYLKGAKSLRPDLY